MLSFSGNLKVYVVVEPCDMRRSFDGLHNAVSTVLGEDPRSGAVFVQDFGDEAGGGGAAFLQGWRQRCDEGGGDRIVDAGVFGPHELDADELGGLEVELLADFLADAAAPANTRFSTQTCLWW